MAGETVAIPVGQARDHYHANRGSYERLLTEVEFAIKAHLESREIKVHSVSGRVKELESFLEKIRRKGYANPHAQTPDLGGVRVVALFLSDLRRIEAAISELFAVIEKDDHIEDAPAAEFGYMSIHYVCLLGAGHAGARYQGLDKLAFEIQIRTIAMDAWANISHHLGYKGESTIPSELRRDFHALSGLFYVADQHFELFFNRSQENENNAEEVIESDHADALSIDLESISALLRAIFPDRARAPRQRISDLVNELHAAGYGSVGDVANDLQGGLARAEKAEESTFKDEPGRFADASMATLILRIVNPKFRDVWSKRHKATDSTPVSKFRRPRS